MKIAALDLGTNTFLCLIAEGDRTGIQAVHQDLMQVVRLGQDVARTGRLHSEALERAKNCLQEFKKEIDRHKVDRILAMATSAARDASNGDELFQIGKDLGIPIEVIPGSDEARITYQGATARVGKNISTGLENLLVVDIGGGSTELIQGRGEKILFAQSLDIGGVRLTEKFITSQPVSDSEKKAMIIFIDQALDSVLEKISKNPIDRLVAVAGTPTSIAAIELGGFDEKKVDQYILSTEKLNHWVNEFARTSVEEKKQKYNLGGRADIIFAGASILLLIAKKLKLSGITVSTKGVRYGIALDMLSRA